MKPIRSLAYVASVALAAAVFAQAIDSLQPPVPPNPAILAAPDPDTAWKPIAARRERGYLQSVVGDLNPSERTAAIVRIYREMIADNVAFIQRFPSDSRRWDAILSLAQTSESLVNADGTLKAPFNRVEGLGWDAAPWVVWLPQIKAQKALIATAPDASSHARFMVELERPGGLMEVSRAVREAISRQAAPNFGPLRAEILRLAEKYPTEQMLGAFAENYLLMRAQSGAEADLLAEIKEFAAQGHAQIRAVAQKEIDKRALLAKPLAIAFTAVDGRAVDLARLRGKVVLVDFWATWCGPCIAELPNVKAVYEKYHDRGFEIIGVALENAKLRPTDTPEQTASKMEKAKKVLTDFTAKENMPWPQYFDGKHWKTDLSTRYGINAIPAMFLIDQEGRLVTTDASGAKLESEVKRLLGL